MKILSPKNEYLDNATDTLHIIFSDLYRFSDEEEIMPGVHVLYAYDDETNQRMDDIVVEIVVEKYHNLQPKDDEKDFFINIEGYAPFKLILPKNDIIKEDDADCPYCDESDMSPYWFVRDGKFIELDEDEAYTVFVQYLKEHDINIARVV